MQETLTNKRAPYPSLLQGWGILGIILLMQIVTAMAFSSVLEITSSMGFMVSYTFTFALALVLVLAIRRSRAFSWRGFHPLLGALTAVLTLVLIFLREPVIQAIPYYEEFSRMMEDMIPETDWMVVLTIGIMAPFLEEFIFRGVMLDGFLQRYGLAKSIIWSSVFFGLAHFNPFQFISAMVIGALMGWLYYKTRSLWLMIFIHGVNNLSAFLPQLLLEEQADFTFSTLDIVGEAAYPYFLIGMAATGLLAWWRLRYLYGSGYFAVYDWGGAERMPHPDNVSDHTGSQDPL